MRNKDYTDRVKKYDPNLCMDDYFPNCDGTRTHPILLSELLEIDVVKNHIRSLLKEREEEIVKCMPEKKTPIFSERNKLGDWKLKKERREWFNWAIDEFTANLKNRRGKV